MEDDHSPVLDAIEDEIFSTDPMPDTQPRVPRNKGKTFGEVCQALTSSAQFLNEIDRVAQIILCDVLRYLGEVPFCLLSDLDAH
jgi:hypothetical protein